MLYASWEDTSSKEGPMSHDALLFPISLQWLLFDFYLFMRKGSALLSETLTTVVSIISQVYIFVIVVKCGYKTITSQMARRATIRWMAASRMRSRDLETFRDRDLSLA